MPDSSPSTPNFIKVENTDSSLTLSSTKHPIAQNPQAPIDSRDAATFKKSMEKKPAAAKNKKTVPLGKEKDYQRSTKKGLQTSEASEETLIDSTETLFEDLEKVVVPAMVPKDIANQEEKKPLETAPKKHVKWQKPETTEGEDSISKITEELSSQRKLPKVIQSRREKTPFEETQKLVQKGNKETTESLEKNQLGVEKKLPKKASKEDFKAISSNNNDALTAKQFTSKTPEKSLQKNTLDSKTSLIDDPKSRKETDGKAQNFTSQTKASQSISTKTAQLSEEKPLGTEKTALKERLDEKKPISKESLSQNFTKVDQGDKSEKESTFKNPSFESRSSTKNESFEKENDGQIRREESPQLSERQEAPKIGATITNKSDFKSPKEAKAEDKKTQENFNFEAPKQTRGKRATKATGEKRENLAFQTKPEQSADKAPIQHQQNIENKGFEYTISDKKGPLQNSKPRPENPKTIPESTKIANFVDRRPEDKNPGANQKPLSELQSKQGPAKADQNLNTLNLKNTAAPAEKKNEILASSSPQESKIPSLEKTKLGNPERRQGQSPSHQESPQTAKEASQRYKDGPVLEKQQQKFTSSPQNINQERKLPGQTKSPERLRPKQTIRPERHELSQRKPSQRQEKSLAPEKRKDFVSDPSLQRPPLARDTKMSSKQPLDSNKTNQGFVLNNQKKGAKTTNLATHENKKAQQSSQERTVFRPKQGKDSMREDRNLRSSSEPRQEKLADRKEQREISKTSPSREKEPLKQKKERKSNERKPQEAQRSEKKNKVEQRNPQESKEKVELGDEVQDESIALKTPMQSEASSNVVATEENLVVQENTSLSANVKAAKPQEIQEIFEKVVQNIQIMSEKGQSNTSVEIKNIRHFENATLTIHEFDHAKGELNITFGNLSNEAKEILDRQQNQEMLKQSLSEKGYTLHILTASTEMEVANFETETESDFRDGEEGGKEDEQEEKERQE